MIGSTVQDGLSWGCSRMGGEGAKRPPPPFPKIFHTYPTMMKLGQVIPDPKKSKKIYGSCDTSLDFC